MEGAQPNILAVVVCDFVRAAIGTRSRLADVIGDKPVLQHVLDRLRAVEAITDIALLVPPDQLEKARRFAGERIHLRELAARPAGIDARVRIGRQWGLHSWRGGAGQVTVFDEEYHPQAIAAAAREFAADHVLVVHSHGIFLDPPLTAALIRHHLHKNAQMKVTYTPSAPGLCGMMLRADAVAEMGENNVLPWQLLAYDPAAPTFDTLIRDACMQVDPALSKVPNRFCVDTERSWGIARGIFDFRFSIFDYGPTGPRAGFPGTQSEIGNRKSEIASPSALAIAAARGVAPGVTDLSRVHGQPSELEIELTACRLTTPPGSVPAAVREGRGSLDPEHWIRWLSPDRQSFADDLLLTFAGDGDPLLYPQFAEVLRAARQADVLSICVQTDLACADIDPLVSAIEENLLDVLSITLYGQTAETYARVAGADLHAMVMKNLHRLAPLTTRRGGVPLVVPRLLKVRETIPEMESFFDTWLQQSGWAVIEGPTDRAGQIPFAGVIDMAPPKRKACRRLWDRMLIRADGSAAVCDQDMRGRLTVGHIESATLAEMWTAARFAALRKKHATALWNEIDPCKSCKEWHRP